MAHDTLPVDVISSSVASVEQLFKSSLFYPAPVQREYKWEVANCDRLLGDLLRTLRSDDDDAEETVQLFTPAPESPPPLPNYYLGALILKPETDQFDVYDGLQRLTTLTILLAILRDLIDEPTLKARLASLVSKDGTDRLVIRIGEKAFKDEVKAKGEAGKSRRVSLKRSDTEQRLRAATKFFRDRIVKWRDDEKYAFATQLLDRTHVGITRVTDHRVARQVFVSTNMHGVPLNRVELLKGQIMDLAEISAEAAEIHKKWDALTAKVEIHGKLDKATGRVVGGLEDFFVAVDFIQRKKAQGDDCLTELAAHLAKTKTVGTIVNWMTACDGYADAWVELAEKMRSTGSDPSPLDIAKWKLRFFWWPEWKPFALWVLKELKETNNPNKQAKYFKHIESLHKACLALVLAETQPRDRELIFRNAIKQAKDGDKELDAFKLTPEQTTRLKRSLVTPITNLETDKYHGIIRWIEAEMWGNTIPGHLNTEVTVEHVLPQEPAADSEWVTIYFKDPEERYDLTHSLGNLVCIDKERNERLKNYDFAIKKPIYLEAQAFKTLSQVMVKDVWTAVDIRAREILLSEYVLAKLGIA